MHIAYAYLIRLVRAISDRRGDQVELAPRFVLGDALEEAHGAERVRGAHRYHGGECVAQLGRNLHKLSKALFREREKLTISSATNRRRPTNKKKYVLNITCSVANPFFFSFFFCFHRTIDPR